MAGSSYGGTGTRSRIRTGGRVGG
ncbi:MAG: hypothetical protein QOF98_403, partial [Streptomyces sp.]|nr:hypothetical protein [Streptomyces sp.]